MIEISDRNCSECIHFKVCKYLDSIVNCYEPILKEIAISHWERDISDNYFIDALFLACKHKKLKE